MTREAIKLPPRYDTIIDEIVTSRTIRAINTLDMDWNVEETYEAKQGVEAPEGFQFRILVILERKS